MSTCLPRCSIWKFLADSCVTLPPKSSWYTWLPSFQSGALLCITNSLARRRDTRGEQSGEATSRPRSRASPPSPSSALSFRSCDKHDCQIMTDTWMNRLDMNVVRSSPPISNMSQLSKLIKSPHKVSTFCLSFCFWKVSRFWYPGAGWRGLSASEMSSSLESSRDFFRLKSGELSKVLNIKIFSIFHPYSLV